MVKTSYRLRVGKKNKKNLERKNKSPINRILHNNSEIGQPQLQTL